MQQDRIAELVQGIIPRQPEPTNDKLARHGLTMEQVPLICELVKDAIVDHADDDPYDIELCEMDIEFICSGREHTGQINEVWDLESWAWAVLCEIQGEDEANEWLATRQVSRKGEND